MQAELPPHAASGDAPHDGPHGAALAPLLYATSVAVLMLNATPAAEPLLRQAGHWGSGQVGAAFGIELAAMGLASIPSGLWFGRLHPRWVSRWAYLLFILGNLLSPAQIQSIERFAATRALAGLGAGTLMILGMSAAARARTPDRVFALVTIGQLASGALLLWAFSVLARPGHELDDLFLAFAALGAIGLLIGSSSWSDTRTHPHPATGAEPTRPGLSRQLLAVVAFGLAFNAVAGGLWSFAGEYAAAGSPAAEVARVMAWASAAGLAGALLAGSLAHIDRRRDLLIAGYVGMALGAALLQFARGPAGFIAGCCLLALAWNFCVPFVFAAIAVKGAAHDASGRVMAAANLAFAFGLAIGPMVAGEIIDAQGLDSLFPCALAGLASVAALTWRVAR